MRPPRRRMSKPVRIALGCPAISSTTSTPMPSVASITICFDVFHRRIDHEVGLHLLRNRTPVFIRLDRENLRRSASACYRNSEQSDRPGPGDRHCLRRDIARKTVCTAFPSGSRIDAYSFGIDGIQLPYIRFGNHHVLGKRAIRRPRR